MGYRIRYHRKALAELDKCRETYAQTTLPKKLNKWIQDVAEEAQNRGSTLSIDLENLADRAEELDKVVRAWPNYWQRFWNASFIDKLRAAHVVMTRRRPPYDSRAAYRVFTVFTVDCDVWMLYLTDHAEKVVVIMAFDGLPMQGYD